MKNRQGYILVSTFIITSVILIISYFLADALFSELAIARNQRSATTAFHLAESGIQEAIWRIQNDSTTRSTFLNTSNGLTAFSHDPALLTNGSYQVNIQNTAKATATITAIGYYKMGAKTAQRRIKVDVTKATTPPPYDDDGAILTGGSTGEEDITLSNTTLTVTGKHMVDHDNDPLTPEIEEPWGSLISNRDIWFINSAVNIAKDIIANREIRNVSSNLTAGGIINEHDTGNYPMPAIDISSESANSYKQMAISQNQYYTSDEFQTLLKNQPDLTLSGVVYVAGSIDIKAQQGNQTPPHLTVNGMLVTEGSIDVGSPQRLGTLTINHVDSQPSGVISMSKFTAWANSIISVEGLFYIGDRFAVDPYDTDVPAARIISIKGGIMCRRFNSVGPRTINIDYNQDFVNEALLPDPNETPVIEIQHWEEEY